MFEVDENDANWVQLEHDVPPLRQRFPTTGTTFDRTVTRPTQGGRPEPIDMSVLNTAKAMTLNQQGAPLQLSREETTYCKVCKVSLSGEEPAKQHYAGKNHRKALQKMSLEGGQQQGGQGLDTLHCSICDVSFTGVVSAKQHYEGKNHKKAEAIANRRGAQQGGVTTGSSVETEPFSLFSGQAVLSGGSVLPKRQICASLEADSTLPDSTTAIEDKVSLGEDVSGETGSHKIGAGIAEDTLLNSVAAAVGSGPSGHIGNDSFFSVKSSSSPPSSCFGGGEPNPDLHRYRKDVVMACSKVMMSMIPEIANKVADMLLSQNPSIVRGILQSGSSADVGRGNHSPQSHSEQPSCSSQSSLILFDHRDRSSSDDSLAEAVASTQVFSSLESSSSYSTASLVNTSPPSKPPGLWPDSTSRPIGEDETKVDNLSVGLEVRNNNKPYKDLWEILTKQKAK